MKTTEIIYPITIDLTDNMDDLEIMEETLQEAALEEGVDYELHIARGDDYPHAATFYNYKSYVIGKHYEGRSTY